MSEHIEDTARVREHWGKKALEDAETRQATTWMNHPVIAREYINRKISGDPDVNWLEYVRRTHVPATLGTGVTLGCGDGGLERHALALGLCGRFDAFDIAEGAIAVARQRARNEGVDDRIDYRAVDINEIRLDAAAYDIAFCSMSAHHFSRLEHVFEQVRTALRPGGLFVLNEFVGPSQFQWTDWQLEIVNDLLAILPAAYRRAVPEPHRLKEVYVRPTIEEMNRIDPSESIRSAEIIPLLRDYFDIVERIDYGGTILQLLVEDIAGNFSTEKTEDRALLALLCHFESTLIQHGVLPSDFSFVVARRRSS